MAGKVGNLRAMFENKDESSVSPPDRGRSPAGSTGMAPNVGNSYAASRASLCMKN
jgi:hypothetical protein